MGDRVGPRTERDKMLAGELYDSNDAVLVSERAMARGLCDELQALGASDPARKREILETLFGVPVRASIHAPFHCDYGYNIRLGENAYFNVNCVVLDVMRVTVGANVLVGPGVHIYTALHPMTAGERRTGREYGKPVTIGDDAWIGGGAIVCPGVSIGSRCVIGAGSVVTRSIPDDTFAAGNPCRVIRRL